MRRLLLLLAAAGVFAAGSAIAQGTASVEYTGDGAYGNVQVWGDEGTTFRIYGEMPDGGYYLASQGSIPSSGGVLRILPALGPTDANAQFLVRVGNDPLIYLVDKEYALD